jgi:hypothetical protein
VVELHGPAKYHEATGLTCLEGAKLLSP